MSVKTEQNFDLSTATLQALGHNTSSLVTFIRTNYLIFQAHGGSSSS